MKADHAGRGAVADEYIDAMIELWTSATPSYQGEHVSFERIAFEPKPVQKPHPPVLLGNSGEGALRRVVRYADGWMPSGTSPEQVREGRRTLIRHAEEAGRDPAEIDLGYWANWYRPGATRQTDNGERMLFTGADADVIDDIGRLRDLGVRHLLFNLVAGDTEQALDHIDRFTTEIRAKAEG